MREFQATRGAAFGPVRFQLSNADKSAIQLSGAIVRLSRSGTGVRDSTVALGEVVVTDSSDLVEWTLPMAVTAGLSQSEYDVELIILDAAGQERIPSVDGRLKLTMRGRASAPT